MGILTQGCTALYLCVSPVIPFSPAAGIMPLLRNAQQSLSILFSYSPTIIRNGETVNASTSRNLSSAAALCVIDVQV